MTESGERAVGGDAAAASPPPGPGVGASPSPSSPSEGPAAADGAAVGERMMAFAAELYPICRSITGDGLRETLSRIGERIPLETTDVPSGTRVFDWAVPKEWNVRGARITGPDGKVVVDLKDHNLHVVGYSVPVRTRVMKEELADRVHTLPEHPDRIPYRTSYYSETWGFCMEHRRWESLPEGEYEVEIDASLEDGHLTYGECVLEGASEEEVLVSCHVCHPSLANDNLSGIVVATELARRLGDRERRYTYRFLFIPGTIGSITWLARNEERADRIRAGLVLAGVGDPGRPTYKRSRRGDALVDRALEHVLGDIDGATVREFVPYGYDERQFCSPGFDLPVGCLMRTPWGEYPEYHTSADDVAFLRPESLAESLRICLEVLEVLEGNRTYRNLSPRCEPQLGKRGLYDSVGGGRDGQDRVLALLWVLNQSDGDRDLLAVAARARIDFSRARWAADALVDAGLLEIVP